MAKKYIKNNEGIVRAVTSDNLQLEKPLLNENYDIEVHNRNMDKIDNAIQEVKGKIDGLELVAERVSIADPTNKFEATNVEDALLENKTSIQLALEKSEQAFQRGDEVKTQLVDKLISEGLNVSTNDTFENLINNITLGKKWASGTTVSNSKSYTYPYYNSTSNQEGGRGKLTILTLDFTPTLVFAYRKDNPNYMSLAYIDKFYEGFTKYTSYSDGQNMILHRQSSDMSLAKNNISIPVYSKSTEYTWVAFE